MRIENLVLVQPSEDMPEREVLRFETLTLINRNLIEPSLLDGEEIAWLDAYHARVREMLTLFIDAETAHWFGEATVPIGLE
jgi:Xaa-Pro aminopeptidase